MTLNLVRTPEAPASYYLILSDNVLVGSYDSFANEALFSERFSEHDIREVIRRKFGEAADNSTLFTVSPGTPMTRDKPSKHPDAKPV